MRLADYTDYALRVLMYCAQHPARRVTVAELAQQHTLARNHVMKIVADLARAGLLETARGRAGGVWLRRPAAEIRVGEVVRLAESDMRIVECFDNRVVRCSLMPACRLRGVFAQALQAYLDVLDGTTLADIAGPVRVIVAPPAIPPG